MTSPNIIPTNIPNVWKMGLEKASVSPVMPVPCILIMVLLQMLQAVPAAIAVRKMISSLIPHRLADAVDDDAADGPLLLLSPLMVNQRSIERKGRCLLI
jgi:hypothetical protein